jgi:hypothetical protein
MTRYSLLLFFLLLPAVSTGQLYINEFMASNTGVVPDPDFGQSADWIELYNSGPSDISLDGYFLTDNLNNPDKWRISNLVIPANGFVLIWADSRDSANHTSFNLSASFEQIGLYRSDLTVVDTLSYGAQDPNISMGRKTDGGLDWVYFTIPTPGNPNDTISYSGIVRSDPGFSITGGVYHNPLALELKTIFGGDVHYTLDGSEPTENSPVAGEPISITQNTVVRARIHKAGQVLGPVNTNTYLIDPENIITKLPIVCVSSDPVNLWDPVKGIYVVHSTKPLWEIPVNIELYENDGRPGDAFNLRTGVKSTGLYSWQLPEKMLGVSFRKEYGASSLDYPLIFDKERKSFRTFSLRASGSDWGNTMFRDGMIQTSAVENTSLDISGFRPCVVYINGEYMGIHNIREKIDADYVVGNHGLAEGTFDMIEETDQGHYAETGDFTANNLFLSLCAKDLTIQSNYDAVAAEMDMAEFTELVSTEVYSGNNSIGHNLMKWKPKGSGKWRWILMDFDRGFFNPYSQLISFYVNEDGWPFRDLMKNSGFKKQFGLKLSDLLFTTFNPERMIAEIDAHQKSIEDEMPDHINRWAGTHGTGNYSNIEGIPSMEYWLSEVEKLRTFAHVRPGVILTDLTKFGFQSPVRFSITTLPAKSGTVTFNGLKVPVDICVGGYPQGEDFRLTADAKAGYKFLGWKINKDSIIIERGSNWKYWDTGAGLDLSWKNSDYSDAAWKSGVAELGYGDGGEQTTIGYGGSSSNKYITSYFRNSFLLKEKQNITALVLVMKIDDGVVVYLNGNEIQRYNMPPGEFTFGTTSISSVTGADESDFHTFFINPKFLQNGNNVIAVEVHQDAANSSDLSFDLELAAIINRNATYLSTSREISLNIQSAMSVAAVFEPDGKCILPEEITTSLVLSKSCSPFVVPEDVQISSTGSLTIEPGVELWMSDGVSIFSQGPFTAMGTVDEPIIFRSNPESLQKKWGNISIRTAGDTVRFRNVIIKDASEGPNPARDIAALAIDNSVVVLDSIYVEEVYKNPINVYNSQTTLLNSRMHSDFPGVDLINVKRGRILMYHCEFIGNTGFDSDAIDFGDMSEGSGIVRNCYFHDMEGFNSDAVDLGDHSKNVIVDSIVAYNIQDKGVSIGQQSSTRITNSVFINCGMGAGMKDSSSVFIDHCTYYGNYYAIANYQKHAGDAGANAVVTNSILSNSYQSGYLSDEYSSISISNSSDDTENLPDGKNNLNANPLFTNPVLHDFSLLPGSALIGAGTDGNIGAGIKLPPLPVSVMISDIAYVTEPGMEDLEFVGIYNPGESRIYLDSCSFTSGFTFRFPSGASIGPGERVFVTSNASSPFWNNRWVRVYQWVSGHLDDQGERIQLVNKYGNIIDQVIYNNKAPWPAPSGSLIGITLNRLDVDNHFGENWKSLSIYEILGDIQISGDNPVTVYPNPADDKLWIKVSDGSLLTAELYTSVGRLVRQIKLNAFGETILDISDLQNGIYLVKTGRSTTKVVIAR